MQVPSEEKRRLIAATATRMFATRPFHKVRLEDIASAAGVGKGTLYVYFPSKEDLYFSLVYDGFADAVDRLSAQVGAGEGTAADSLHKAVHELVRFAFQHPQLWELMRTVGTGKGKSSPRWDRKRLELTSLLSNIIQRGISNGEFSDPHPELTALYIPGLVRSVMLFGPKGLEAQTVTCHILRILQRGLAP